MLGEIVKAACGIRLHGLAPWSPVGRAYLTVLIGKLESIQQSESFINGATHRKIVYSLLSQNTIWRNDEKASQRNTGTVALFDQDFVVLGDGLCDVRDQGILESAKTTLVTGSIDPVQMRKDGIHRATKNLDSDGLEFFDAIAEGNNLSGAHKGPVKGIEEQYNISAFKR